MKQYIKFTGEYTDLKKKGFTFQKLFANNHMCWHKKVENQNMWIWKKGNEVEFEDLYNHSRLILEAIQNNTLPEIKYGCYAWSLNREESKLYPETDMVGWIIENKPTDEEIRQYRKGWRTVRITTEFVDFIKEMQDCIKIENC